jgi:hypothetical protein
LQPPGTLIRHLTSDWRAVVDVEDDCVQVAYAITIHMVAGNLDSVVVTTSERAVVHLENGGVVGAIRYYV